MMAPILFTLGHSTQSAETVLSLLQKYQINAVCDVRSTPYSRRTPHFNREAFKPFLNHFGIAYLFMGTELGGRPDLPGCIEGAKVIYSKVAANPLFHQGSQDSVFPEAYSERQSRLRNLVPECDF